jgi:hypothetical protein
MLNEKLFMDQILKDRVMRGRGIDKFLLFTCAFVESGNYEEGATSEKERQSTVKFDEGKKYRCEEGKKRQ